jgi:multidrug efflux system membrane fusion protein
VQGGGPVQPTFITNIVSIDPVYVTFDVDENTWNKVGTHLRAATTGGIAVPVSVGLIGEDGHPHLGQVVFIDNRIDQGSGSIRVRAKIPNPDRQLTPGAFARVRLQIAPPKPVLLVHERAILSQINSRYVYVVDENKITQMRTVRLGESIGTLRIVDEGLSSTDQIVVVGHAKLFMPNMPVAPQTSNMETATMVSEASTATTAPVTGESAKP